jgi:hypothetical protein
MRAQPGMQPMRAFFIAGFPAEGYALTGFGLGVHVTV